MSHDILAGRAVARIGYGAMQLRHLAGDAAAARALLRLAIDLGADHIDTAQFYGGGFVNQTIATVVRPDDRVLIATKIGADPDPAARVPIRLAQRPAQLRASVEANLAGLGLERLPLVYLRRPDLGPGATAEGDQIVDLDDQLAVLTALRDEGKIGALGLSGVGLDGLRRAMPAGIACVQNAYSLVSRELEAMLTFCRENGVAWVPFFPLGGAAPGWPKVTDRPEVIEIAARLGATPSQLALAWLLGHGPNIFLIPGTANAVHLRQNLGAGAITLDARAKAELDGIAAG